MGPLFARGFSSGAMVKNKRRALAVLIAVFMAFVVVAFFAHSSITTLFRHYHQDEKSLTPATQWAWQLKHQEKLQELLRLETTSSKQMDLVQQQVELLQQQNLQLQASLKAANVPARNELRPPKEPKSTVKSGPAKASPSTAKTGNFQRQWAPAEKGRFPSGLYGPLPQSLKDSFQATCSNYRARVPYKKRMLGVAGLFNTGTNLLAALLDYNCNFAGRRVNVDGGSLMGAGPVLWQVPYGKHHPSSFRGFTDIGAGDRGLWSNSGGRLTVDNMMPVIVVKDPLTWMTSMCRTRYLVEGEWHKKKHGNCPSLTDPAKSAVDVRWTDHPTWVGHVPVNHSEFASMIDFWSTWHRDYANLAEPPIFVRFEDLLFDTAAAIEPICKCAGGTVSRPVHMMTENVKIGAKIGGITDKEHHSTKQRYADPLKRAGKYSRRDLEFIRDHPDGKLMMERFGYFVDPNSV